MDEGELEKQKQYLISVRTGIMYSIHVLRQKLLSFDIPQKRYITEVSSWEQAFLAVKDIKVSDGKKQILVIDEFSYIAKENPGIPSILQKLWDTEFRNSNVMIILCGSAMSYIEKEI